MQRKHGITRNVRLLKRKRTKHKQKFYRIPVKTIKVTSTKAKDRKNSYQKERDYEKKNEYTP